MKTNYVKELRHLLEGEVEQAEVIIAAKGFSQELQDMIEKVGRLMNEDLGPVTDQMRQAYGPEVAGSFQTTMQGELESVLGTLRGAKESMDSAVASISTGRAPDATNDMDSELGMDDDLGIGDDLGMGDDLGIDNDDLGIDDDELGMDDEFGGDEPLGRATKESKEAKLMNQIVEMRGKLSKIRKLKEAKALREQ